MQLLLAFAQQLPTWIGPTSCCGVAFLLASLAWGPLIQSFRLSSPFNLCHRFQILRRPLDAKSQLDRIAIKKLFAQCDDMQNIHLMILPIWIYDENLRPVGCTVRKYCSDYIIILLFILVSPLSNIFSILCSLPSGPTLPSLVASASVDKMQTSQQINWF